MDFWCAIMEKEKNVSVGVECFAASDDRLISVAGKGMRNNKKPLSFEMYQ